MSPIAMAVALTVSIAVLAYSLNRRWQLLQLGQPDQRLDRLGERIKVTLLYAFGQRKMPWYPLAGAGHILIFFGFLVLLLRSLIYGGAASNRRSTSGSSGWSTWLGCFRSARSTT
jgi:hypothetical protein